MDEVGGRSVEHRLATYGTLAPGEPNEHVLAGVSGTWMPGVIRGHLEARGWGAASGHAGIVLDEAGPEVGVHVLTSADLPDHWQRLDDFEGDEYVRVPASVRTDIGVVTAYVYALAP